MTSNTQHGNHRKIIESFNKSEARNTNRLEIFQEIMARKAKKSIAGKSIGSTKQRQSKQTKESPYIVDKVR